MSRSLLRVLPLSSLSGQLLGGQCGLGHVVTAAESACDATIAASALGAEPPPEMLLTFPVVNRPSQVAERPVPPEGGGVYLYQQTSCAHGQVLISAVTSAC